VTSKNLDDELKAGMDNNKYKQIREKIQEKSNATSQQLQRTKHKKFNSLKYRPKENNNREKKNDQTAKGRDAPKMKDTRKDRATDNTQGQATYAATLQQNKNINVPKVNNPIAQRNNQTNQTLQTQQHASHFQQQQTVHTQQQPFTPKTTIPAPAQKNLSALSPEGEGATQLIQQLAQDQKETKESLAATETAIESLKNQFQLLLDHLQIQQTM